MDSLDDAIFGRPVPLARWRPVFPPGPVESIVLHWTAGDYTSWFSAYHFCVGVDASGPFVIPTNDIRANLRDLRGLVDPGNYAAHVAGRNSFAIGVAAMAMLGAEPHDFGTYPITDAHLDALCQVAARIARFYALPIDREHVYTHAEAAARDNYFGAHADERWDIARFVPSPAPLSVIEAGQCGASLRARIAAFG